MTPRADRPRSAGKAKTPLPSRKDLLAYIAEHPGQTSKRDIARAFGITGSGRIDLKSMLKKLAEDGLIEGPRRRLRRQGDLPSVTVVEITGHDRDGDPLAVPAEWPSEHGDAPVVRITLRRGARGAHVPGLGDRVLARLRRSHEPGAAYDAAVIKVLPRQSSVILGVVRRTASGWRLEPVDRKQKELLLETDGSKVKEGDLVSVAIMREERYGLKRARISEVVGSMKNEKAVSLIALLAHNIPFEFSKAAISEARAAQAAPLKGRDDWRDMPLVTIDPADARDHDDAVHAEPDPDPQNKGGHIVTVAIADVSHYVRPRSELDRTALERGNSVYFPDRVVPMLPERISNDLCSLRHDVERPALAVRLVFSPKGQKKSHRFYRVMMRSAASLSYEQAQDVFDGRTDHLKPSLSAALANLWRAYRAVAKSRDARAPLALELPERKVILDADGHVERIAIPPRLEAHRLIEEFMIQANVAAAETLEEKRAALVYRIHDNPSPAKLEALRDFLKSIEMSLPRSGNFRPEHFNHILGRTRDTEYGPLVSQVVLRTQSQAEYSPENIGHFGLNLRRYAHFTSPIRRYADLIVHRALIQALGLGKDGLDDDTAARLPDIAAAISLTERRAMTAERDTIDRLMAHWLADRVGSTFTGRISGVTRSGLFVRLDETGADGFVPMSTLGTDYFRFDEERQAVIGDHTAEMHRLGDAVEVKLIEAAPVAGGLRFELLSDGRVLARGDRPKRRAPLKHAGHRRTRRRG